MPDITVNVMGEELARELAFQMDTVSLSYFIHELVTGLPTQNIEHLIDWLVEEVHHRKEMEEG